MKNNIKQEFEKIKSPKDLLFFMSENLVYGYVDKDKNIYKENNGIAKNEWFENCIVQIDDEILETLHGTCWDQVEIERYWFEKNNYEIKTSYIYFQIPYDNEYSSHSILTFKDKDKYYWFENSDFRNRGIHEYETLEALLNCVKNIIINDAVLKGISDSEKKKICCSEYKKPKKNSGVWEFIENAIEKEFDMSW